MKQFLSLLLAVSGGFGLSAQNLVPVISNVQVAVDWIAKTMTVQYDVADAENDLLNIRLELSDNGGASWLPAAQITWSGDTGTGITAGPGKTVIANLAGVTPVPGAPYRVRITALDGQSIDLQALVDEVDSTRLRGDLDFVQGIRHRTAGVPHLNEVRDSMQNCFNNTGLSTSLQTWNYGTYMARNVIANGRGIESPGNVVIVDAHYDSVANAPGADDNGSGTVGVMEIARVLGRYPCKKSLRFIGFDVEEAGLVGSIKYVQSGIPAGDTIAGVLNFEMIGFYSEEPNSQSLPAGFNIAFPEAYSEVEANGFRGDFITNVGNTFSESLINLFAASAATYVPDLKVVSLNVPGNGELVPDLRRSDHAPFWSGGYKALMLTDGANFRNESYHTPNDTLGKLNFTFMSQVVKATLATAATLVEPLHGSISVTTVDSPSGTSELAGCMPKVFVAGKSVVVEPANCNWTNPVFSLVDMNGKVVVQHHKSGAYAVNFSFNLPDLPAGTYVIQISSAEGFWSRKVAIN